jgi:HlyD family secretion protein
MNENQALLNAVEEVRPVDVQIAQAELQSAKASVKRAQADLNLAYVRAPKMGQILKIHTWPGEIVDNAGIVDLGQTDQMYVTAEVYETDISRVRIGQKVAIKSDGIVGDLQGAVDEVGLQIGQKDVLGTDPVADADARVVEVKIRINPGESTKIANLTNLQVSVIIDTSDSQALK